MYDSLIHIAYHYGGDISFGPDGNIYISTGDKYNPENSKSMSSTSSKILRITKNGDFPADNIGMKKSGWYGGMSLGLS